MRRAKEARPRSTSSSIKEGSIARDAVWPVARFLAKAELWNHAHGAARLPVSAMPGHDASAAALVPDRPERRAVPAAGLAPAPFAPLMACLTADRPALPTTRRTVHPLLGASGRAPAGAGRAGARSSASAPALMCAGARGIYPEDDAPKNALHAVFHG